MTHSVWMMQNIIIPSFSLLAFNVYGYGRADISL